MDFLPAHRVIGTPLAISCELMRTHKKKLLKRPQVCCDNWGTALLLPFKRGKGQFLVSILLIPILDEMGEIKWNRSSHLSMAFLSDTIRNMCS